MTGLHDPTDIKARMQTILTNWGDWLLEQLQKVEQYSFPYRSEHQFFQSAASIRLMIAIFRGGVLWEDANGTNITHVDYNAWMNGRLPDSVRGSSAREAAWQRDFERMLFPRLHGCKLFLTERGRVGIVASNCLAQAGDEVWLLQGSSAPFVLRRVEQKYRLITSCYVSTDDYEDIWEKVTLV